MKETKTDTVKATGNLAFIEELLGLRQNTAGDGVISAPTFKSPIVGIQGSGKNVFNKSWNEVYKNGQK